MGATQFGTQAAVVGHLAWLCAASQAAVSVSFLHLR